LSDHRFYGNAEQRLLVVDGGMDDEITERLLEPKAAWPGFSKDEQCVRV